MLGTLVNTGAILFGSLLGLLLRRGLPQRLRGTVMQGLGLCVALIGVKGAIGTSDTLCVIVSIVAGGLLGAGINIERRLEQLGSFAQRKLLRGGEDNSFAKGFVSASLVFCVGAMAIMGSLSSGLYGDHSTLIAKAAIRGNHFCQHHGAGRSAFRAGGAGLSRRHYADGGLAQAAFDRYHRQRNERRGRSADYWRGAEHDLREASVRGKSAPGYFCAVGLLSAAGAVLSALDGGLKGHGGQCVGDELLRVHLRVQPVGANVPRQHNGHTRVNEGDLRGSFPGQDGKGRHDDTVVIFQMVNSCQINCAPLRGPQGIFCSLPGLTRPLEIMTGGDQAAALLHAVTKQRLICGGLYPCIDDWAVAGKAVSPAHGEGTRG